MIENFDICDGVVGLYCWEVPCSADQSQCRDADAHASLVFFFSNLFIDCKKIFPLLVQSAPHDRRARQNEAVGAFWLLGKYPALRSAPTKTSSFVRGISPGKFEGMHIILREGHVAPLHDVAFFHRTRFIFTISFMLSILVDTAGKNRARS